MTRVNLDQIAAKQDRFGQRRSKSILDCILLEIPSEQRIGIQPGKWIVRFRSQIVHIRRLRLFDEQQLTEDSAIGVIAHLDTAMPIAEVQQRAAI